jgi:PEP-CTERM motif
VNTYKKWFSAFALTAIASASSAAVITATPITSSWHDSVGQANANIVENVSFGRGNAGDVGDGEDFNQARWGAPFLASATAGRSGLGFRSNDPVTPIVLETAFNLGTLRHYNWTIALGSFGTASQLDVGFSLDIDGVSQGPYSLTTQLTVDETPNNTNPCPYQPSPPGLCADNISFTPVGGGDTFTIGGVIYTLEIIGFGTTPDSLSSSFISQEGGISDTNLWARITAADPPAPVPEPAPLALLALGLLGLGLVKRRNK